MSIAFTITQPTSVDSVTIASNDPLAAPIINPNFLSTETDRVVLREVFRAARRLGSAPAFDEYRIEEVTKDIADTDKAIDDYLRATAVTLFHPTGTAKMSSKDDKNGVVGPDLRVKGVKGLRVCDASIFVRICCR